MVGPLYAFFFSSFLIFYCLFIFFFPDVKCLNTLSQTIFLYSFSTFHCSVHFFLSLFLVSSHSTVHCRSVESVRSRHRYILRLLTFLSFNAVISYIIVSLFDVFGPCAVFESIKLLCPLCVYFLLTSSPCSAITLYVFSCYSVLMSF